MAMSIRPPALTLAILVIFATVAYGGLVGGRTEIAGVKTNKAVQELGRFSVEEHNRRLKDEEEVKFVEVVEAQQQVVSGIKYYLKISATQADGGSRMFDSVVVVKPWLRSKQLLNFAPSAL
ncbi:cysteine proteinase inhibitor 10 [Cajanus cajan]|uniref:Cysteine proteinase inhibitor 10 n=1 Tax=Cajanus cajan TaxID=3821 RepID=A0A151R7E3_CAJCA|nr:cysteine proteinase inhibitor 10 [Cajanus cajan]KYP38295.1 Cysteine proteinase inhibitor 10 [Cajanus cajan]